MGRSDFTHCPSVRIDSILLDSENPRIRSAENQEECMSRVLRRENQMYALMSSIAEDSLSTMPILITPYGEKWIVKDGNRRIAALKLLNNPGLCPSVAFRRKIESLRKKHHKNIPSAVDCLSCDNLDVIAKEIALKHSGEMGGAGLVTWSSYLRTVYELKNKQSAQYKRAGQYLLWAEDNNVYIDDDFPITNISRFLSEENLKRLGFDVKKGQLSLNIAADKAVAMANIVVDDFFTGRSKTDDVFIPEQATSYLDRVNKAVGISVPALKPTQKSQGKENSGERNSSEKKSGRGSRPPSPARPNSDRRKLFNRSSPEPIVPLEEAKARTIIYEIKKVTDVHDTPLTVAMLLRALIELSDSYYRRGKKIADKGRLSKNVEASADAMLNAKLLTQGQLDLIKAYTRTQRAEINIFNIDTLQKYIHRDTHHPSGQVLNTFWEEIGCFVRNCWE